MSKFTSTPGQPHRVAPTITRNGRTTEGLTPMVHRRACSGSILPASGEGGQNDFHDAGLGVETEATGRA